MRVCVVDDPRLLPRLPALPADDDVRVVARLRAAPNIVMALRAIAPDVVVLDLRGAESPDAAPGDNALIDAVRAALPQARVLVVGPPQALPAARAALSRGAAGYLSGDPEAAELASALRTLNAGGVVLTRTGQRAVAALARDALETAGAS